MTAQSPAQPDLAAVVDLARHAPSVHNTQPWQFAVAPGVLTLRRDETRRLPVLDPESRQVTISCGAAVHLARLGMRAQGLEPATEVVRADSHGIEVRIAAGPGDPAAEAELALVTAARERHMQRGRFESRPVADDVVRAMRVAAEAEGAWVRFLATSEEQVPLAVLLAKTDELERDDPAYRAELAQWAGRPAGSTDGLPAAATASAEETRASDLTLRRFSTGEPGGDTVAGPADDDADPPVAEHPLVVVLGTTGDSPHDWLVAGQAMSALLVRATADGVRASPLGQVLDQPWARRRLAGELGVVGHPQMVLRLGYAEPGPETPRRPVDELLT
ncbi:MAG TPA: nitroreductase family protein [Actinomycetes bacterium]|nr:nitroreductase family protein [Actinomycetes bacterium]